MTPNKQIVFMHIAKAAGSSINNIFAQILGEDQCCFHIEWLMQTKSLEEIITNKSFVSGHVYSNVIKQINPDNAIKFTVLREPYSHLVSHLLWLDHYGQPGYEHEYKSLNQDIKALVDFIASTDLANPYDLDHLLVNLPSWGIKLLNNCQARYLIGQPKNFDLLSLKSFPLAINNLRSFDVRGTLENLPEVIKSVLEISGVSNFNLEDINTKKKVNKQISDRSINLGNPLVRSILQKHILLDIKLYNSILNEQEIKEPNRVAAI